MERDAIKGIVLLVGSVSAMSFAELASATPRAGDADKVVDLLAAEPVA